MGRPSRTDFPVNASYIKQQFMQQFVRNGSIHGQLMVNIAVPLKPFMDCLPLRPIMYPKDKPPGPRTNSHCTIPKLTRPKILKPQGKQRKACHTFFTHSVQKTKAFPCSKLTRKAWNVPSYHCRSPETLSNLQTDTDENQL